MKRYLLFAGDKYYPYGGWEDFKGSFDLETSALVAAANEAADWWQVVDTHTGEYRKGMSKTYAPKAEGEA